MGAVSPSAAFSSMMSKFGLATICGYQTVWGVTPALHSPLMSVTNAISGLTAVGGMALAGGGILPGNTAQTLAALAIVTSAVNIGGGFTITQRMLDMFSRPGDPKEHNNLFAYPAATLVGGYLVGSLIFGSHATGMTSAAYLASSAMCIAAIGCLANQSSARMGNALGAVGVGTGLATTLMGSMAPGVGLGVYVQVLGLLGAGMGAGHYLGKTMKITELPQMVAAFHSLVGLAACVTSISVVMAATGGHDLDMAHKVTAYLGDFIGAITMTGQFSPFDPHTLTLIDPSLHPSLHPMQDLPLPLPSYMV